ncbi:M23 family metallopeptidase [Caryophanon tenue]|uniref:M23ase beta-sheet core domain-containing protein n=1 Tax=Caryophanon tenue TaxID=33978 RepID=A0A1C0YHL2_9BACL|nr:M23 family metallopeptidase [Caryophanon tenue]OCS86666.1 hypothetical protein A6M13_12690 [Caryophanon tenue]
MMTTTINFLHIPVLFKSGDFGVIYDHTSEEFQQLVSRSAFETLCREFNDGVRYFELFLQSPFGTAEQLVWLDNNGRRAIQLLHENGVIISFALKPFVQYASDKTYTKNRYELPICDDWYVFWGGTNVFENYHYEYENQRYAYDLVRRQNNSTYSSNSQLNEHYYAFGTRVVAPLHGKVVKVVDGIADNVPGDMNTAHPAGNYVVLKHSHGEYSFLAHFQQHSIVVKEGDTVKQGQILGKCGNSGNSSEAHIHFHVMDGPVWEKAKSIRIQFEDNVAPTQGDVVTAPPPREKRDIIDTIDDAITWFDILIFVPRIIGQFFRNL